MDAQQQLLFFFSALGAFNGFILSVYFAFFFKERDRAIYFLAALFFVLSVRVAKSVFFTFSPSITDTFLHVGLTACLLIGPFLYLYIREVKRPGTVKNHWWVLHILPVIGAMIYIHYYYPYAEYGHWWKRREEGYFGWALFVQWFIYIALAAYLIRGSLKNIVSRGKRASDLDFWLFSVVGGVAIIWLAYFTTNYTSYIVGALSFSFVIYLVILLLILKRKNGLYFLERPVKYENKKIDNSEAEHLIHRIDLIFKKELLFKNVDLKIGQLAEALKVSPHYLSQSLNDNLGVSFPNFVNAYRIKAAEEMIRSEEHLTLEAIGRECGFKSKTTFYKAFKKENGVTPAAFKRAVA